MTASDLVARLAGEIRLPLHIDRILYELNGPAIFTTRIGLSEVLCFKGD